MILLYNIGIALYVLGIHIAACFRPKARLFLSGRKDIFKKTTGALADEMRQRAWFHCASLGEFEQARPLIEMVKQHHPDIAIVLTFFSPSGYEVRKNYHQADYVFYLPIDTARHAAKFVRILQPQVALFAKYEFWYHYLHTLHQLKIPTILFSAIFQQRHPFFKWYGGLHRRMLQFYQYIFVQDPTSFMLLESLGISKVTVVGDTRFDRVAAVLHTPRSYSHIELFKGASRLLVAGSTWPDDEVILQKTLGVMGEDYKLLIVPHETDHAHIAQIQKTFHYACCLWTDDEDLLKNQKVGIVNEVGHLSHLYRYADVAWVGGGFTSSGVHNVLEPAVYGVPVFFGNNFNRFKEAVDLIGAGGAATIRNEEKLVAYLQDKSTLNAMGQKAGAYVQEHAGATSKIYAYLVAAKCF